MTGFGLTVRRRRWRAAVTAVLAAAVAWGCAGGAAVSPSETRSVEVLDGRYTSVSPDGLAPLLAADVATVTVVNVHVPYEGEIEGTDVFVPYNRIGDASEQLPPPSSRLVVYCLSGNMSRQAAATLVAAGYTDVWELEGGMLAWERSGRQLADVQQPAAR